MKWFVLKSKRVPFDLRKGSFWLLKGFLLIAQTVPFVTLCGCGNSAEQQQLISREQRRKLAKEDSLALKIAVTPTIDCLPLFVAKEKGLFQQSGEDIRLRYFTAHMDCDTAIVGKSVEGMVSELVRTEWLRRNKSLSPYYLSSTNGEWKLLSARKSRIKKAEQLDDKMVAMTRHSATDVLTSKALEGIKLKSQVYRIQINDVNVRLSMIVNNEIDAAWLQEPLASQALLHGAYLMTDSKHAELQSGVIAFREEVNKDKHRQAQLKAFTQVYNMACDSLNKHGLSFYADVIGKYYKVDAKTVKKIKPSKFKHITPPKDEDIEKAKKELSKLKD